MPILSSLNASSSGLSLSIGQRVRVDLQCTAGDIRQAAIKAAASFVISNTTTAATTNPPQQEIILKMSHGEGNVAVSLAFANHAENARQLIFMARFLGMLP